MMKLVSIITSVHLLFIGLMCFSRSTSEEITISKKIKVHTITLAKEQKPPPRKLPSKPVKKTTPVKKKTATKKTPPLKKKNHSKVVSLLKKSLDTLEAKPKKSSPTIKNANLPTLKIEQDDRVSYHDELALYLESMLVLPEEGSVKIDLTLKRDGSVASCAILFSQSVANQNYINDTLPTLHPPPFGLCYKNKTSHTFTITLDGKRGY